MGLNPLHFNGARLPQVSPEPFTSYGVNIAAGAGDMVDGRPIWKQFGYQNPGNISREDLARIIQQAEYDIAEFLGYWPSPVWISQEYHKYPRENRVELYGGGVGAHGQMKGVKTNWGKIIAGGRRNADLEGTPVLLGPATSVLVYSMATATDGWNSLATITQTVTATDPCELRLYFANHSGDPAWEIRPLRSVAITGGIATITVESWKMILPSLWDAIPKGQVTAIDATPAASYVDEVEVRREYTDSTENSAQFLWEHEGGGVSPICCTACGGIGCTSCSLIAQDGCLTVRDAEGGFVSLSPADYSTTNSQWEKVNWTECREPDAVKIWYKCGELNQNWLNERNCTELDRALARNIAHLATARMPCGGEARPIQPIAQAVTYYSRNLAESGGDVNVIFTPPEILNNPFGTRQGEVEVYRSLHNMRPRLLRVSAVAA